MLGIFLKLWSSEELGVLRSKRSSAQSLEAPTSSLVYLSALKWVFESDWYANKWNEQLLACWAAVAQDKRDINIIIAEIRMVPQHMFFEFAPLSKNLFFKEQRNGEQNKHRPPMRIDVVGLGGRHRRRLLPHPSQPQVPSRKLSAASTGCVWGESWRLEMYTAPYRQSAPNNSLTVHSAMSRHDPVVSGWSWMKHKRTTT